MKFANILLFASMLVGMSANATTGEPTKFCDRNPNKLNFTQTASAEKVDMVMGEAKAAPKKNALSTTPSTAK